MAGPRGTARSPCAVRGRRSARGTVRPAARGSRGQVAGRARADRAGAGVEEGGSRSARAPVSSRVSSLGSRADAPESSRGPCQASGALGRPGSAVAAQPHSRVRSLSSVWKLTPWSIA